MVFAGDDFDDRVAAELSQRLAQFAHGPFEIERVELAGENVQLAGQLWTEHFPISFELQSDVVLLPSASYFGIDSPRAPVPELPGLAAIGERAEDGLERTELPAALLHVIHVPERVVPQRRFGNNLGSLAAHAAGQRPALAFLIHVQARRWIG